ncbi:hypothetical protein NL108_009017 [Boleophthalmus pectinirostris]|nr:hypothetical protein NL108_009017 [Boleophthalmus pectinirostris]
MHTHLIPPFLLYFLLFQPLLVRWLLALQSSSPQQLQQSPRQYPWPRRPYKLQSSLIRFFLLLYPFPSLPLPPPPLPQHPMFSTVSPTSPPPIVCLSFPQYCSLDIRLIDFRSIDFRSLDFVPSFSFPNLSGSRLLLVITSILAHSIQPSFHRKPPTGYTNHPGPHLANTTHHSFAIQEYHPHQIGFRLLFILQRHPLRFQQPENGVRLLSASVLNLVLHFGKTGIHTYDVLFATQATGRLQQINHGAYWGVPDFELYCRVFTAHASLSCDLYGAPFHPASLLSGHALP